MAGIMLLRNSSASSDVNQFVNRSSIDGFDLLRAGLEKWLRTGKEASQHKIDAKRWADLVDLGSKSKSLLIATVGLRSVGIEPPAEIAQLLQARQAVCLRNNMSNMASAVRICAILRSHGIDVVCLKGVPRGYEVYNRWDVRTTGDVDLLVAKKDYREAAEVIAKNGYRPGVPKDSLWWHQHLGESPYVPETVSGPIVDLHWKLTQPGTPALSDIDGLLGRASIKSFGSFNLPTLHELDALMLSATSVGKAIRSQDPWLREAHEIAMSRASNSEFTDDYLAAYAGANGIGRLWEFVSVLVDRLFPPKCADSGAPDDLELIFSALGLESPHRHAVFRTQLLWAWTDGVTSRPFRFARELTRVRTAELRHDYEERIQSRSRNHA